MHESAGSRDLYLDLLVRTLINTVYQDPAQDPWSSGEFDAEKREVGLDWPSVAHSMIGRARMDNLRMACETVLQEGVPGDFIETGVWRGGACILMSGILAAYGDSSRVVWVADSFEGLPEPDPDTYEADRGDIHHTFEALAISMEEVKENFRRYDLLDDRVRFLKGWFKDTLDSAPIDKLAVLRLDGDMYESTMDALTALYDKVQPGGFVIVDDYGAVAACEQAVTDFRTLRGISCPIIDVDGIGAYWRIPAPERSWLRRIRRRR